MNAPRRIENENLKERSTYFFRLLMMVAGLILLQFLLPVVRPRRFTGSIEEWILAFILILFLTGYFLFDKIFVSITFDPDNEKVILKTLTLINGEEIKEYNYPDISFKNGQEAGGSNKQQREFIEIYNKGNKVIKLKRSGIGDYPFDNILAELKQLNN